jgi:hypothetical protein
VPVIVRKWPDFPRFAPYFPQKERIKGGIRNVFGEEEANL